LILTKIVFTVFHNRASDILRGSKQWWTLDSKISRGPGPSNPRRIDAYVVYPSFPTSVRTPRLYAKFKQDNIRSERCILG